MVGGKWVVYVAHGSWPWVTYRARSSTVNGDHSELDGLRNGQAKGENPNDHNKSNGSRQLRHRVLPIYIFIWKRNGWFLYG